MKILFFADLHARKVYRNLSSKGILKDSLDTISEIEGIAKKEGVSTIFCLGDLFHKTGTVSIELLSKVFSAFRELKHFNLYFLLGNHDLSGDYSVLECFKELGEVIEDSTTLELGGRTFYCYPFTKGTFLWKKADVLLGHFALAEGELDATDVKLKQETSIKEISSLYKLGLLGHYHQNQKIGNFYYVGSSLQLSFAEAGQKKFCVILDTEDLKLKWVSLKKARKYRVIDLEKETDGHSFRPGKEIIKFLVPHDKDISKMRANIPRANFEYFIERKPGGKKIEKRLESSLNTEELIEKFLELSDTKLNKAKLKKLACSFIEEVGRELEND